MSESPHAPFATSVFFGMAFLVAVLGCTPVFAYDWRAPGAQRAYLMGNASSAPSSGRSWQQRTNNSQASQSTATESPGVFERMRIAANERAWQQYYEKRQSIMDGELKDISRAIRAQLSNVPLGTGSPGSRIFGTTPVSPREVLTGAIGSMITPASGVATEDLRRATIILSPVIAMLKGGSDNDLSPEDLAYLGSQAAEAMEGGAVNLVIPDSTSVTQVATEDTRALTAASQELQQLHEAAEAATARSPSDFVLRAPNQMAGAIWDGLMRSRA